MLQASNLTVKSTKLQKYNKIADRPLMSHPSDQASLKTSGPPKQPPLAPTQESPERLSPQSVLKLQYPKDQQRQVLSEVKSQPRDQVWRDLNSNSRILAINQSNPQERFTHRRSYSKQNYCIAAQVEARHLPSKAPVSPQAYINNLPRDIFSKNKEPNDLNRTKIISSSQQKQAHSKSIKKAKTLRHSLLKHLWNKRNIQRVTTRPVSLVHETVLSKGENKIKSEPKEILLRMFEHHTKKRKTSIQVSLASDDSSHTHDTLECPQRVVIGTPSQHGSQERTISLSCFEDESLETVREFQLQTPVSSLQSEQPGSQL